MSAALLPYKQEVRGGISVSRDLLAIRSISRNHLIEACNCLIFENSSATCIDDETVDLDALTTPLAIVDDFYGFMKEKQLNLLGRERLQLGFVTKGATNPSRILLRVMLALTAVCLDWDSEGLAPMDLRPPRLFIRLSPFLEGDMQTLMNLLTTGPEETNISQIMTLANLYQGQAKLIP